MMRARFTRASTVATSALRFSCAKMHSANQAGSEIARALAQLATVSHAASFQVDPSALAVSASRIAASRLGHRMICSSDSFNDAAFFRRHGVVLVYRAGSPRLAGEPARAR